MIVRVRITKRGGKVLTGIGPCTDAPKWHCYRIWTSSRSTVKEKEYVSVLQSCGISKDDTSLKSERKLE